MRVRTHSDVVQGFVGVPAVADGDGGHGLETGRRIGALPTTVPPLGSTKAQMLPRCAKRAADPAADVRGTATRRQDSRHR